jgi:hypothetical protein
MKLHLSAFLFVAVTGTARAQEGPLVGQPAPPFSADTCINRPMLIESDRLKGEVILLEFWGIT